MGNKNNILVQAAWQERQQTNIEDSFFWSADNTYSQAFRNLKKATEFKKSPKINIQPNKGAISQTEAPLKTTNLELSIP